MDIDKEIVSGDDWKRTPDGKFAKGNRPGPGQGKGVLYKDRIRYADILRDCVTDEDFADVAKVLLSKAKAGEAFFVKELLDRLLGKPKQIAEVDVRQQNVDPRIVVEQISLILGITNKEDDEDDTDVPTIET